MIIKNVTGLNAAAGGNDDVVPARSLTRRYFNKLGKTLQAGQATIVTSSISILDVISDLTFLKDAGVVTDAKFVPATWAGYEKRVKVGNANLALVDNALINPVNPVISAQNPSGTPVNIAAGNIKVFLTTAERAFLTKILSQAGAAYVPGYELYYSSLGNAPTSYRVLGASKTIPVADDKFDTAYPGMDVELKYVVNTWTITATEGDIVNKFTRSADASAIADYKGTVTVVESGVPGSEVYTVTLSNGTELVALTKANFDPLLAASSRAHPVGLSDTVDAFAYKNGANGYGIIYGSFEFGVSGAAFGAAGAGKEYTCTPFSVNDVEVLNHLAKSTVGLIADVVPSPQSFGEAQIDSVEATEPVVTKAAVSAPSVEVKTEPDKPKRSKKSIADLEAANADK